MEKTVIVMLHRGKYPPSMQAAYATSACKESDGAEFRTVNCPYSVAGARNCAVRIMYELDCDSLLFVDEDVSIQSDCVARLRELGSPVSAGQVPAVREISKLEIPHIPLISGDKEDTGRFEDFEFRWMGESQEIIRSGAACMLVRREVFDALGFPWFRWPADLFEDDLTGEDFDFCNRVRKLGFKIMVHADVRCGHAVTQDVASRLVEHDQVPHDVNWNGPITQADRHAYPVWGSHIPVLLTLAENYSIKSVVEFGAGKYSTPLFLDRNHFPDLTSLVSFENDIEWKEWLEGEIDDDRLEIAFGDLGAMPARSRMVNAPDLVLIDSDAEAEGDVSRPLKRVKALPESVRYYTYNTREAIFERYADTGAIVVVHDINEKEMGPIATSSLYKFVTTYRPAGGQQPPHTGVFSNKHDVSSMEWKHILADKKWGRI